MSIKDDVKAVNEEFGELVFERFEIFSNFDNKYNSFESNDDFLQTIKVAVETYLIDPQRIVLKPLPELFAHDKVFYINAFEMWEISLSDKNNFIDATDNRDVEWALNSTNYDVRRKASAPRPFDLDDAKAGDVVYFIHDDGVSEIIPTSELYLLSGREGRLRMKFPKKVRS